MSKNTFIGEPLRDLVSPPRSQVPALDFLRALAILLVVNGHLAAAYALKAGSDNMFTRLPMVRGGWIGVDLFFVLSGYLIGTQLWRELRTTGTINFSRFILRRGLRIWPLYFFFLFFVLAILRRGAFPFGKWWSDPIFLTNYLNKGVVLGSWSLCTEEQFYLVAPAAILMWGLRTRRPEAHRKYLWFCLALLPMLRALIWWRLTGDLRAHNPQLFKEHLYQPIHTHADGLVMGLLIANYQITGARSRFLSTPWAVVAALVTCLALQRLHHEIFDFTGITLVFGSMVWFVLAKPAWLSRLFSATAFFVVSRLSFGMYLNHEYMQENVVKAVLLWSPIKMTPIFNTILASSIAFMLSALVALCTYCLIESPFLKLRHHLLSGQHSKSEPQQAREEVIITAAQLSNR